MPDAGALERKLGSKYFKPVGFPESTLLDPKPVEPPKEEPGLEEDVLQKAVTAMWRVVEELKTGTSPLKKGAMHFEKNTSPSLERLKRIEAHGATRSDLVEFLKLVRQDFGDRVGLHFASLFDDFDPTLKDMF
jgi:hypothetical protein